MSETVGWEGTTETSEMFPGTKRSPGTAGLHRWLKSNMQISRFDSEIKNKTEPCSLFLLCYFLNCILKTVLKSLIFKTIQERSSCK